MKKLFSLSSANLIIRYILVTITIILISASQTTAQVIGTGLGNHTLAVKADGTVYAWGYNLYGQLGNGVSGSGTNSNVPVIAGGDLSGKIIIAVASGNYHSIALTSDGKVYTWGYNAYGQLGNGESGTYSNVPVAVADGDINFTSKTIIAIAAGSYHSIALDSDGKVYTWGRNNYGQLGNEESGAGTNSNIPVAILSGDIASKTITAIAAGAFHSIAIDSDGKVYTWGHNGFGQLGNGVSGSGTNKNVPVAVVNGGVSFTNKTITAVAAGFYHSIALDSDGNVYAWGYNANGQLGTGNTSSSNVPVAVVDGAIFFTNKIITAIATGFDHSIALDSEGKVYTWGYNQYGQLGNGVSGGGTNSNVPVAVADGDSTFTSMNVTAIAAGANHSTALDSDGNVYSWGYNFDGQLGNGDNSNSNKPVPVDQSSMGALPVELTSFTATVEGNSVSLNWQTATEVNNYGFEIERATVISIPNGRERNLIWEKIGFVQGHGNSNSPKSYSFTDAAPPCGKIQYRLKQIDTDGTYEYYGTITEIDMGITGVQENEALPSEFALMQNYPNPFNPSTVISYQLPAAGHVTLKVYDVLGREVVTLVNEQKAPGKYEVKFDGSELAGGVYFYKIQTSSGFVSTKKLTLLK